MVPLACSVHEGFATRVWLPKQVARFSEIRRNLRVELNRVSCDGRLALVVNRKQCANTRSDTKTAYLTGNCLVFNVTVFAFVNRAG